MRCRKTTEVGPRYRSGIRGTARPVLEPAGMNLEAPRGRRFGSISAGPWMKAPTPIFHGKITDGRFVLDRRKEFAALKSKLEGAEIDLRLSKHRKPRSLSQNAYYWAVVIPLLAEHCGYEAEEIHDALKWQFLQAHEGGPLPTVMSTAGLDTAAFTEYIEQCRRLAASMGVVIPNPGEAE